MPRVQRPAPVTMPRQPSREDARKAEIQAAHNRGNTRLFRNNVGKLRTPSGGFVSFGLGCSGGRMLPGTSDLIGWESVEITPAMVGKRIAVFVAVEVKDLDEATEEQLNFIEQVRAAGGLAGVAHDAAEAAEILGQIQRNFPPEVKVTPDMVGQTVVVAKAIDVWGGDPLS